MGRLVYDHVGNSVDLDDRILAHLQVVIGSKLRRGEPFYFSWRNDVSTGSGRNTAWIHPSSPLTFRYSGNRAPQLNPGWIDVLIHAANSPTGLYVVPEPEASQARDPAG